MSIKMSIKMLSGYFFKVGEIISMANEQYKVLDVIENGLSWMYSLKKYDPVKEEINNYIKSL